ncbi:DUF6624 domain-containing protein [Chitinophaga eiseniae]|uniref:Tetratricopeptide repeat-containing protein n=1 Tax=Chitinophaga eiseniae TaxID=634771 RepID=A0A847SM78_9BACT|nr:DUF6624 domain-containing protein [Chitinophaga eiseniae]NLR78259.1 hypothetical protein [Chitinophaga eiseniae]
MKYTPLLFCLLCFHTFLYGQPDTSREALAAKAGFCHLREEYKTAIRLYEQAFAIKAPDPLEAYKAAEAYALDNNTEKASYYLHIALEKGWTEADWLLSDPYFDHLRQTDPRQWKEITTIAIEREKQLEKTLRLPQVRKAINQMVLNDQFLRRKRVLEKQPQQIALIDRQIQACDSTNLLKTQQIIRRYGWPLIRDIGKDGQNNLWLLVQHADQYIPFQKKALSLMEKFKGTDQINSENLAFLYDRVQCNLNHRQYYGTQVEWGENGSASGFRPIREEDKVNDRRKQMGMRPLSLYSLTYGFAYTNIDQVQAMAQEQAATIRCKNWIDSALLYYKIKAFSQTYDYYNLASTIPDGMSNAEMHNAAVLFAKIFNETHEDKYAGISTDFLYLLFLRKYLTAGMLKNEPAFQQLHHQKWREISGQLK